MSEHRDTNVGSGTVPHRKTCQCDECTVDRLQADKQSLRSRLAEYEKLLAQAGEAFTEGSAAIAELQARLAEADALLREIVAWRTALECVAPELGGAIMTMNRIDAHLSRKEDSATASQPSACSMPGSNVAHILGSDGACEKCGHWFHPARTSANSTGEPSSLSRKEGDPPPPPEPPAPRDVTGRTPAPKPLSGTGIRAATT